MQIIMKFAVLSTCAVLIFILGCAKPIENRPNWKLKDGYVPDEQTAGKVAEAILTRIYGNGISDNKQFKVRLKDSTVWIIEGTLKPGKVGGTPYIEIQKTDGKILKVQHLK